MFGKLKQKWGITSNVDFTLIMLAFSLAGIGISSLKYIKHQVNKYAGDGNVDPDRQEPAGNLSVFLEIFMRRMPDRHNVKRRNDHGQRRVRS